MGVQIRVTWHRQKELDQGNIRLLTPECKAHRGTKYTGELPSEWSQGLPPPRLPNRPPRGKKSSGLNPPP